MTAWVCRAGANTVESDVPAPRGPLATFLVPTFSAWEHASWTLFAPLVAKRDTSKKQRGAPEERSHAGAWQHPALIDTPSDCSRQPSKDLHREIFQTRRRLPTSC